MYILDAFKVMRIGSCCAELVFYYLFDFNYNSFVSTDNNEL